MSNTIQSNRLKTLRQESNITQEQLADYLGVDQSLVAKIEKGTRAMNVTLMHKICSLFGCSESYLLGEDDLYIPLQFAFRSGEIQAGDLESIAAVNRIVMNIRHMNELLGEDV